ncbi:MAG: CapA family protein [Woeseia sp.]
MINRRELLMSMTALPLAIAGCQAGGVAASRLRITLAGQALMTKPFCVEGYDGYAEVVAELRRGDIVFSDLEVAIKTAASGAPTRDTQFMHMGSPAVLDCLQSMGFNLLALSNNHAWDLGTEGVLATRAAVLQQGFVAAGTGSDIAEASAAAVIERRQQRVALVAMATEKIRDGAAATATRAGVNELRLVDGVPHDADVARVLQSLRQARRQADFVIAYHHNHDWGADMSVTRPWAKDFARQCADAGADLYLSHGAPLLHGLERYGESLLLFGLGSLVFHSITPIGYYPAQVWESAIVHCDYRNGILDTVEVVPVVLNELGDDPARQNETRGRPRLARGADARRILQRLASLSDGISGFSIDGERARIATGSA